MKTQTMPSSLLQAQPALGGATIGGGTIYGGTIYGGTRGGLANRHGFGSTTAPSSRRVARAYMAGHASLSTHTSSHHQPTHLSAGLFVNTQV